MASQLERRHAASAASTERRKQQTVNKACRACNRKKIKCDTQRPICGLCCRTGSDCTFPARQDYHKAIARPRKTPSAALSNPLLSLGKPLAFTALPLPDPTVDCECSNDGSSDDHHNPVESPTPHEPAPLSDQPPSATSDALEWHVPALGNGVSLGGPAADFGVGMSSMVSPSNDALWGIGLLSNDEPWFSPFDPFASASGGWGLSPEIGAHLIELFFDNAQGWLTFIHRPTFERKFVQHDDKDQVSKLADRSAVSEDEAFLLLIMFAIAARFSHSEYFKQQPVLERGTIFATRAANIKDRTMRAMEQPTHVFLQACVVLAFYYLADGQIGSGSVLTSICVRYAYDLSLDAIDNDLAAGDQAACDESADRWLQKEGLRRLWWSIWELDTFISTMALYPSGISKSEDFKVLLPAPDSNWLSGRPLPSAFVDPHPEGLYRSLQHSPNQSPRAWFLVADFLKTHIILAARRPAHLTAASWRTLDYALCSLKLALPTELDLRSLYLDETNHEQGNWVVATHLMILVSEAVLGRLGHVQDTDSHDPSGTDALMSADDHAAQSAKRSLAYLLRVAHVWSPEHIPQGSPLMCCAAFMPGSTDPHRSETARRNRQIARAIATHSAKYWKIGLQMHRLLSIVEQGLTSSDPTDCSPGESDERNVLMKQFSVLVPAKLRHNRCCVLGTHDHHQAQRNKDGEDGHDNNSSPSPTMDNMLNYDSMDGLWQDWSVLEELESAVDAVVPQHSMV